jgi:protein-S-isoprenylcysteine O-methyltransferase Ste14
MIAVASVVRVMWSGNLGFGFLSEITVISLTVILHLILPGEITTGYCCDNQTYQPLLYKLNGLSILLTITALFLLCPPTLQTSFADYFLENLFAANLIGLALSFYLFTRGGREKFHRCLTVDQIPLINSSKKIIEDKQEVSSFTKFYLGCEWNPRFYGIDSKMILYAIGAVHLQLNLLSFTAQEYYRSSSSPSHHISLALLTYLLLFTLFLYDYMFFEKIHLYTYDLFAEKLGFKLTWGCLVFYPFFYCIGIHSLVSPTNHSFLSEDISLPTALLISSLYLLGSFLTRGANLQKYYFKISPQNISVFFGILQQETLPGSNHRILISGFWGIARHVNYLGEIIQSVALTLPGLILNWHSLSQAIPPVVFPLISLLYPLFYILLFISRQIDDDRLCGAKYGALWDQYCQKVPWRIFPGVW